MSIFDDHRLRREMNPPEHVARDRGHQLADDGAPVRPSSRNPKVALGIVAVIVAIFVVMLATDSGNSNSQLPDTLQSESA